MRVLDIVPGTSVDGPGLRTAIYMAGCRHECPGCHNRDSWSFSAGRELSVSEIMTIVRVNGFPVTLTGGDPLYSPDELRELSLAVKADDPRPLWLYTGFTFEQIAASSSMQRALEAVDVVVEGPFIEEQRSLSLLFRGSANQRIIMLRESLECGAPVLWTPPSFGDIF